LRYFTVYGPRQRPDMAFCRFMEALVENQEIGIFGDGEQTREFTYVSDAVDGTVKAASADVLGQIINLGGGGRVTVNRVLDTLTTDPVRASISSGFPASRSWSMEVLCSPTLSAPAMRRSMVTRKVTPSAWATASVSRIIAAASSRAGAKRQMPASVARVSALM